VSRYIPIALFLSFVGLVTAPAFQAASDSPLKLADLAWDEGDYPTALRGYLRILDSPQGDAALEAIALRTGELYRTIEVTTDGALPQFSPDGTHFTYENGTASRRVIRLLATASPDRPLAELKGWDASFSPDGTTLAYLKMPESPDLTAAQTAVDTATTAERAQRTTALNALLNAGAQVTLRHIASGRETTLETGGIAKLAMFAAAGNVVVFAGAPAGSNVAQLHVVSASSPAAAVTGDETVKVPIAINRDGTALLFSPRPPGTGRGGRGGGGTGGGTGTGTGPGAATGAGAGTGTGGGTAGAPAGRGAAGPAAPATFGVMSLPDGNIRMVNGTSPSFSGDGRSIVFVTRSAAEYSVMAAPTTDPGSATVVRRGPERVEAPAASPDGSRIAYQLMARDDWEIYAAGRDGGNETRLTRDIQHDLLPRFLAPDRLVAVVGEPRHRRSFLYDLGSGRQTTLFHNNTVRTIAPEYLWAPNHDGTRLLVVAERDGDTVSPERGIYLVDLTRQVTRDEVRARVAASLAAEEALRANGTRTYAPIADAVRNVVSKASVARVYSYEKALYDFDSKHISRPGNKLASAYLFETYKSFGYSPEFQWFDRQNALGGKTANVVATLRGTVNPELIYVVSSHYDSVAAGPGADDDSSGTAALLETARLLAAHPQPATIVFASFTGEEAGLLGSREFVRRAVADKLAIVGALNNDMVGWANDFRLDNTIRYSNPGIRDIQHAAAMQFSKLITYDARYYKGTDAAAYYEAFGDIVGGIGSYPVLSSPHYHQSHDVLENMNHQLITEVARTTAATLMLLASSPSRLTELKVDGFAGGSATLSWKPSPERGVSGYIVAYGPPNTPHDKQVRVMAPTVKLSNITPGTVVAVKAVNAKGLEGWDWARVTVK
jgi:peptidase M28-like protein/WD40 repeat protein